MQFMRLLWIPTIFFMIFRWRPKNLERRTINDKFSTQLQCTPLFFLKKKKNFKRLYNNFISNHSTILILKSNISTSLTTQIDEVEGVHALGKTSHSPGFSFVLIKNKAGRTGWQTPEGTALYGLGLELHPLPHSGRGQIQTYSNTGVLLKWSMYWATSPNKDICITLFVILKHLKAIHIPQENS